MLHRVIPDAACAFGLPSCYRIRGTALTPDELSRLIAASQPIITLEQVEEALAQGSTPPSGRVLTFDDGYREHSGVVAEILSEAQAQAVFYVSEALHAGSANTSVVDAWYWLLDHARQPEVSLFLPDGSKLTGRLDRLEHKRAWVWGTPKAALLASSWSDQWALIEQLADAVEHPLPPDLAERLYMSQAEWTALARLGHRVGAHGVHHRHLTSLEPGELEQELQRSLDAVPAGAPLAYPDGAFDDRVMAATRRVGATSAVTCEPGTVRANTDPYRLPRRFIRPGDVA